MNVKKQFVLIICRALLSLFLLSISAQVYGAEETVDVKTVPTPPPLPIEIFARSNSLPKELIDLQNKICGLNAVDGMQNQMSELSRDIDELESLVEEEQSNPHKSYHRLSSLDSRLATLNLQLDSLNGAVESNLRLLGTSQGEWDEKLEYIRDMQKQMEEHPDRQSVRKIAESMELSIGNCKNLIEKQIELNLLAGKKIGEVQTRVYVLDNIVSGLIADKNRLNLSKTSHSMLSAKFYRQFNGVLMEQGWHNLRLFGESQLHYLKQNFYGVVIGLSVILLLSVVLKLSKSLAEGPSRWFSFASKPLISAVFITSTSFAVVNNSPLRIGLPPEWDNLLLLPMILAVALLTENVCATAWQSTLLSRLALFLVIIELFIFMEVPEPLVHLLVLYILVADFFCYLYLFVRRIKTSKRLGVTWAIWIWGLFPLVIIVAGITGYDHLAVFIFEMVLSVMVASLVICLVFQMISGLSEMILLHCPVEIIRQNSRVIVKYTDPVLILFGGLLWVSILLIILRVYPTLDVALQAITSAQFILYSLTITPGSIMMVMIICYTTLLCSKVLKVFLMQAVLPRYGVKAGTQVSITRLVHYAILTAGFFLLLKILGCDLGHLAFLGGALGVGIGFGLQAIVNNFVSGLILLFERPIKVGDVIELGEEFGEVKELGLRATIVQTYDDAEIVIPNSELITGSVTNWTLAEKHARVKVPVSVAYGSDVESVADILTSCGNANSMVLSEPKPKALLLSFGASSMDFELWVWIADFTDKSNVINDLNRDVESRFRLAGIEMPFQQTDLHLRTIDKKAADVIQNLTKRKGDRDNIAVRTLSMQLS